MHKYIIGIIIVSIILVVGVVLWSYHDLSTFRKEIGEQVIIPNDSENKSESIAGSNEHNIKSELQTDTDIPKQTLSDNDIQISDEPLVIDTSIEEIPTSADTRVSPYGFGPYPELPDRWPENYWDNIRSKEHELIGRVRIKLYEQGSWTEGIHLDDATGMVHPIYKDTVYVEWSTYTDIDGSVGRYITSSLGHPDTMSILNSLRHPPKFLEGNTNEIPRGLGMIRERDLPSNIKFMTYDEGAIDPYEFLNLEKEK